MDTTNITDIATLTGILPYTKPGKALSLPDSAGAAIVDVWSKARYKPTDTKSETDGLSIEEAWKRYLCRVKSESSDIITDAKGSKLGVLYRFPYHHETINALCAQQMAPCYATDPYFAATAVDPKLEDRAPDAERAMRHLCEDIIDYKAARRKVIERAHIEGVGIMHIPYRRRTQWTWDEDDNGSVETVYDAPACEVIPRDRFFVWPETPDIDNAVLVGIQSDMQPSELLADRERPESERLYTISDEAWQRFTGGNSEGKVEQDGDSIDERCKPYTRLDVYTRLPMRVPGGGIQLVLCLLTVIEEANAVIQATPCKLAEHVPVVLWYPYDHGDALDGKSTVDLIDAPVMMAQDARTYSANIARINALGAMTPIGDADEDFTLSYGQFNRTRGNVTFPPQIVFMDGERLAAAAFQEMARATGINDNMLGQVVEERRTATETRAAMGGASLISEQSTRLLEESDTRSVKLIARQQFLHGQFPMQFATEATDAETYEAEKSAAEAAAEATVDLDSLLEPDGEDIPLPKVPTKKPKAIKKRTVSREAFGSGIVWSLSGNAAGIDKQASMNEMQWFIATCAAIDALPEPEDRKWELKNRAASVVKLENVEKYIGPKPDPNEQPMAMPGTTPMAGAPGIPMNGAGGQPVPTMNPSGMMGGMPMGGDMAGVGLPPPDMSIPSWY